MASTVVDLRPTRVRREAVPPASAGSEWRYWQYRIHRGRVLFTHEAQLRHARLKQGVLAFLRDGSLGNLLTTPLIYSLGFPLVLLDLWATLYQRVCFPVYGIALVPRRAHIVIDRHKLGYLNAIEKIHCVYCSYATGVLTYVCEIAARTEHYWCPIKHARRIPAPHTHYERFFEYGDGLAYRRGLQRLRHTLRRRPTRIPRHPRG